MAKFLRLFVLISVLSPLSYLIFSIQRRWNHLSGIVLYFTNDDTTDICVIEQCSNEESTGHGELFRSIPSVWSSCYADLYLSAVENHSRLIENLVDVGANKAYAVSSWLAFFLPESGIDPARLGLHLTQMDIVTDPCGSCGDCEDQILEKTKKKQLKLNIHAIEPQPGTVDVLKGVRTWMNITDRSQFKFEIHGIAVSE